MSQFKSVHPLLQTQVYDPLLLIHVPLLAQGVERHSSTSSKRMIKKMIAYLYILIYLPKYDHLNLPIWQSCPCQPFSHSHLYDPSELMQVPLFWHGDRSHSFLSVLIEILYFSTFFFFIFKHAYKCLYFFFNKKSFKILNFILIQNAKNTRLLDICKNVH